MQTVYQSGDFRIVAAEVPDAIKRLREAIESREYWLIIHDASGLKLIEEMLRYYDGANETDSFACLVPIAGGFFNVAVMRRSWLLAPKLRWLLGKHGTNVTASELVAAGAVIRAYAHNASQARALARRLNLETTGEDLGMDA